MQAEEDQIIEEIPEAEDVFQTDSALEESSNNKESVSQSEISNSNPTIDNDGEKNFIKLSSKRFKPSLTNKTLKMRQRNT